MQTNRPWEWKIERKKVNNIQKIKKLNKSKAENALIFIQYIPEDFSNFIRVYLIMYPLGGRRGYCQGLALQPEGVPWHLLVEALQALLHQNKTIIADSLKYYCYQNLSLFWTNKSNYLIFISQYLKKIALCIIFSSTITLKSYFYL